MKHSIGDNGDDLLYEGAGNNSLEGGVGNDKLYAGDGDNILYGGLGQDALYGGNGRDLFVLGTGAGGDTIFNFVAGTDYLGLINGLTLDQLSITPLLRKQNGFFLDLTDAIASVNSFCHFPD